MKTYFQYLVAILLCAVLGIFVIVFLLSLCDDSDEGDMILGQPDGVNRISGIETPADGPAL